ncbi:MAG TPA: hypothetical protein V6C86_02775 [Oculatellaceae cyanobacterium]
MKEFIKKIYFLLALPLEKRVRSELLATITSERAQQSSELARLDARISELHVLVETQAVYLDRLRAAGLHSMLARKSEIDQDELDRAISALVEILGGTETSIASVKYSIPADKLLTWARRLRTNEDSDECSERTASSDSVSSDYSALCEAQLIYNVKQARDRESLLELECARLQEELELSKSAMLGNLMSR